MRENVKFEHLLSALQRSRASDAGDPPGVLTFAKPFASAALPIQQTASDPGLANLWDRAAVWAPEPDPGEPPNPQRPSDELEAIAQELDLASASTRAQILQARRCFMWKYHPDRRPDMSSESASRRVAVANMLVDRALEGLGLRPTNGR